MKRATKIAAGVGLALLVGGGVAFAIRPDIRGWPAVPLLLGAVLLLIGLLTHFGEVKRFLDRRTAQYGINALLMVVFLLGIIILIEALSSAHNKKLDLTEGQRYTLSDQTIKILKGLSKDVTAVAFYQPTQPDRQAAQDLLRQYGDLSPHFRYQMVDPDRYPGQAKRYGIELYGTVVLDTKDKSEKFTGLDEEKLTNALVKVTRSGKRTVYFLKGHGEADLTSSDRTGLSNVKGEIEKANYQVKDLLLAREPQVPDDAAVLVVAGPKKELAAAELASVKAYLVKGGKVCLLLDPYTAPDLVRFVADYGIGVGDDFIVDRLARVFGTDYLIPVVSTYSRTHPITKGFGETLTAFPFVRSVARADRPPSGVSVEQLAETGPGSWAETSKAELDSGQVTFDEGKDRRGPIAIAAVASIEAKPPGAEKAGAKPDEKAAGDADQRPARPARLVVFGSSAFINNNALGYSGNRDLFLNTLSWLAEQEDLIAIRPREARSMPLFLTATQGKVLFWVPIVVVPAAIIVTGGAVLFRRRRGR